MAMNLKTQLAASLLCVEVTGCASMQAIPSKMKSMVSRSNDSSDPLGDRTVKVSPGFKAAKKELKAADKTMLSLARWSEERDDLEEAQRRYRDLVADNPDNVEARTGAARVEFKSGRKLEAEKILQATVRKFPESSEAWIETGRLYAQMQQWSKATSSFQRAIEIDGEDRTARYEMGIALAHNDQLDEAVTHLTIAGGESAALYNIGYILHQSGRNDEAATWFRRSLNSQPDEITLRSAAQMLTALGFDTPNRPGQPSTQLISQSQPAQRQKSTIDVEQTSFLSYRETPGLTQDSNRNTPGMQTEEDFIDTTGRTSVQYPVEPAVDQFGVENPIGNYDMSRFPNNGSAQTAGWQVPDRTTQYPAAQQYPATQQYPAAQQYGVPKQLPATRQYPVGQQYPAGSSQARVSPQYSQSPEPHYSATGNQSPAVQNSGTVAPRQWTPSAR